ncbi:MAG TPA: ABC transporter ATP-binding protein [Gemmatimonadaceae bacterium]|nr:ABC transporter ATP-binding protein [Gemmatimonadaceae bacterium]
MIRFREVSARYPGAATPALDRVSLDAPAQVLTAVVGPNGSGKSTLIRAMLARIPLAGGQVIVGGQDVHDLTRREAARRVAVVVQREEPAFPMRVRDYLALGRYPHAGAWGGGERDAAAVERAARDAEVAELLERGTDALSGGEWQRVRLARALAQETPAIALDEPTTFLDVGHEMAAFELLAQLARAGRAVFVVSHQLNLVARFAHHVVLLHRGRVVAAGAPDEVMRAAVLESVYEWPLVVARDPAVGAPTLIPLRRVGPPRS